MKKGHHCAQLRGFDGGGAMDPAGNGRRLEGGAAIPRLEVGDGPDGRAPPASDRPQKNERGGGTSWAGGRDGLGRCGLTACAQRKGRWPGALRAERGVGPVGEKREGEGFLFSFLNSFQIHFSNFQTSIKQKSMHSNHDAQTLIISRLF
jgi:hypothetical protein